MVEDALPRFRYHPDPVGTGSVERSDGRCRACGLARGFIYTGPVYAREELDQELCPWCIADGSAARTFGAEFTDVGWGVPDGVADAVLVDLATRTPGFAGWQQEHWLYHCSDAAAYLGRVGFSGLSDHPDALDMVQHEHDEFGWSAEQSRAYANRLSADGESTAYLFRCLSCGRHLAYSDMA